MEVCASKASCLAAGVMPSMLASSNSSLSMLGITRIDKTVPRKLFKFFSTSPDFMMQLPKASQAPPRWSEFELENSEARRASQSALKGQC